LRRRCHCVGGREDASGRAPVRRRIGLSASALEPGRVCGPRIEVRGGPPARRRIEPASASAHRRPVAGVWPCRCHSVGDRKDASERAPVQEGEGGFQLPSVSLDRPLASPSPVALAPLSPAASAIEPPGPRRLPAPRGCPLVGVGGVGCHGEGGGDKGRWRGAVRGRKEEKVKVGKVKE
jgi:hypothetical protein